VTQYSTENAIPNCAKRRSDAEGKTRKYVMHMEIFAKLAVGANRTRVAYVNWKNKLAHINSFGLGRSISGSIAYPASWRNPRHLDVPEMVSGSELCRNTVAHCNCYCQKL
jgi:hypothetical protein